MESAEGARMDESWTGKSSGKQGGSSTGLLYYENV